MKKGRRDVGMRGEGESKNVKKKKGKETAERRRGKKRKQRTIQKRWREDKKR